MKSINVAIAGIGNCAAAFIQGIQYYRSVSEGERTGLMHEEIGGWRPEDIEITAAFDIDRRKVGKPLHEAVTAPPNCTIPLVDEAEKSDVIVQKGPVLDGYSPHTEDYPEKRRVLLSEEKACDVADVLKRSGAEILINFLPVGSQKATEFYAAAALRAGTAFINCIPVFIGSNREWIDRFDSAGLPLIGDDIKTQVGATIVHRALTRLFEQRGARVTKTYQLNVGGNHDFLNMLNRRRLSSKKTSKTEAIQSQLSHPLPADDIHVGPSDYIPWLNDRKICHIHMQALQFGGAKAELDVKLSVEDSPNCAAMVTDAVRCCKMALERGLSGALSSVAAYTMKHPPDPCDDEEANRRMRTFIQRYA